MVSFTLAFAVAPSHPAPIPLDPVGSAAIAIFLSCTARVWAGAHWPSDVIGGFRLALGLCPLVLWLPEVSSQAVPA